MPFLAALSDDPGQGTHSYEFTEFLNRNKPAAAAASRCRKSGGRFNYDTNQCESASAVAGSLMRVRSIPAGRMHGLDALSPEDKFKSKMQKQIELQAKISAAAKSKSVRQTLKRTNPRARMGGLGYAYPTYGTNNLRYSPVGGYGYSYPYGTANYSYYGYNYPYYNYPTQYPAGYGQYPYSPYSQPASYGPIGVTACNQRGGIFDAFSGNCSAPGTQTPYGNTYYNNGQIPNVVGQNLWTAVSQLNALGYQVWETSRDNVSQGYPSDYNPRRILVADVNGVITSAYPG